MSNEQRFNAMVEKTGLKVGDEVLHPGRGKGIIQSFALFSGRLVASVQFSDGRISVHIHTVTKSN